jgi:hypothetical protein
MRNKREIKMKITAFNGSPKAEHSSTNVIVRAFLNGAEKAGAEVENIFLAHRHINYCSGCFSCWLKTPGVCVQNDDMKDLLEKYMSSDIICFATPVHTWNMSALLKTFVDRLIPLRHPVSIQANDRYDMKARILKFPDSVVISNSGFPGAGNFKTVSEVFRPCNPILEIYRNCGQLLHTGNARVKDKVEQYLEYVKTAGFEITKNKAISDDTKTNLQMELVNADIYLKMMQI